MKGLDNYKKAGRGAVLIANHTSYLDALLLGAFLPDQLTYAINTHVAENGGHAPHLHFLIFYPLIQQTQCPQKQ
ncbi:MAG: hypothetical protein HOI58_09380 [Kordiimonadaceae bacterium]|nr:hypothetical protein [Kordiimonadaceae bacterium]